MKIEKHNEESFLSRVSHDEQKSLNEAILKDYVMKRVIILISISTEEFARCNHRCWMHWVKKRSRQEYKHDLTVR